MAIADFTKPKTQAGKRYLKNKASKLIENDKTCLFLNGRNASQTGQDLFKSLHSYKRSSSLYLKYGRKNCTKSDAGDPKRKDDFLPFEDIQPIERLCRKNDASLFAVTTNNKKRPNNVVLGRLYNHQLLDMVEMGVEDFKSLMSFKNGKVSVDNKPCLMFSGIGFSESSELMCLKSILIDFFKGPEATQVNLAGFELAMQFVSYDDKVLMRCYKIKMVKSGTASPRVELEEIGPSVSLVLRRTKISSDDLLKLACTKPKALKAKTKKNISRTALGTTLGRVHMQKQDYGALQTRKTPAIKKAKHERRKEVKLAKQALNAANAAMAAEE